jgi:flagellar biosynthesis chaperone FliJ
MKMNRLETLQNIFAKIDEDKKEVVQPLLEQVVYLEGRLEELKQLPHIRVHPKNPLRQEVTAAGKQYKEFLQQYNNCIKVLLSALSRYTQEEEDEFDKWIREQSGERNGHK